MAAKPNTFRLVTDLLNQFQRGIPERPSKFLRPPRLLDATQDVVYPNRQQTADSPLASKYRTAYSVVADPLHSTSSGPSSRRNARRPAFLQWEKPDAKQMPAAPKRRIFPGEAYTPLDLKEQPDVIPFRYKEKYDPFENTFIDPTQHYKNIAFLNEYVSDLGRIQPRRTTGLNATNQRKVAKLIRRARAFGILPVLERHYSMPNSR